MAGQQHYLGEVDDIGRQGSTDEAVGLRGIVQEARLQRDQAVGTQLDLLHDLALLPVPEGECVTIR